METVFVLTCDWDAGDGRENEVIGVFAKQEDAEQEMIEQFKKDKEESRFAIYFENGKLIDGAEGIDLEERRTYIGIFHQYSEYFIEYCIVEHKVQ